MAYLGKWSSTASVRRVWLGNSRHSAIREMCLQCVGGVRDDVKECLDQECPLWKFRPYQEEEVRLPRWVERLQGAGELEPGEARPGCFGRKM